MKPKLSTHKKELRKENVYCVTKKFTDGISKGIIANIICTNFFAVGFRCENYGYGSGYEVLDCVKIAEAKDFFDFSARKQAGEYRKLIPQKNIDLAKF